jgi:hypothetical protein
LHLSAKSTWNILKKIRKGNQLKLTNPKNAGRPAIHDIGIRQVLGELTLFIRELRFV